MVQGGSEGEIKDSDSMVMVLVLRVKCVDKGGVDSEVDMW